MKKIGYRPVVNLFLLVIFAPLLSGCWDWWDPFGLSNSTEKVAGIIDSALNDIEHQSKDWQFVLEETQQKLMDEGQSTIANEVNNLVGHAIQGAGIETRCTIGFTRNLVVDGLKKIKARALGQNFVSRPRICQPVPAAIDINVVQNGRLSYVTVDGYNLDQDLRLFLVDNQGFRQEVTQHFVGGAYLRTINVGANGIQFSTSSSELAIEANGVIVQKIDIVIPVIPTPPPVDRSISYMLKIKTGNREDGGTDGDVHVQITGVRGESEVAFLGIPGYDDFERGDDDYYYVEASRDLGEIQKVTFWLKNSTDGWFLERVIVTNPDTNQKWTLTCNKWLDAGGNDQLVRSLYPNRPCQ